MRVGRGVGFGLVGGRQGRRGVNKVTKLKELMKSLYTGGVYCSKIVNVIQV